MDSQFPLFYRVDQHFPDTSIPDVPAVVRREFAKFDFGGKIRPGQSVAVGVPSRGVRDLRDIVITTVACLRELGLKPYIIPAMGSHGGSTGPGQASVLAGLGITEATAGVPVKASMDVVRLGKIEEGAEIFLAKDALNADHIVVVNRVKPHTDFMASIESGLMKMLAIGLGKQKGADFYHKAIRQLGYPAVILSVAREVLKRCPIAFGLALVENQRDETEAIEAVKPEAFEETEKRLLRKAKRLLPKIPLDRIDLLIVDRMGKDLSGTGMDQNVIARSTVPFSGTPMRPRISRIFVRDLTPATHGNALGIGNADYTTKRLVEKIDYKVTYRNCLTGCTPELARIPMAFATDRQAVEAVFATIGDRNPEQARVVWVADTLHLETMAVSTALMADAGRLANIRIVGSPRPMAFDRKGRLVSRLDQRRA